MIYIYQDKTNNVITRFSDRRKYSDSYFIWEIKNPITGDVKKFILNDISDRPCSFNLFKFIHSSQDCSLLNGYVEQDYIDFGYVEDNGNYIVCLDSGHNYYTVYETTEYSLDEQYIVGEIESDIMFIEIKRKVNTSASQINDVYY
jgi:hypothetical protein